MHEASLIQLLQRDVQISRISSKFNLKENANRDWEIKRLKLIQRNWYKNSEAIKKYTANYILY